MKQKLIKTRYVKAELSEGDQVTVWLSNVPLKKTYEFVNYNNFGYSPFDSKWDKDNKYKNIIGELADIHLCEYRVGNKGEIRIGKWHCGIEGEEVDAILAKYRELLLKTYPERQ